MGIAGSGGALNVIQGLKLAGADMIIGVDINNDKKAWGERFGMTHFVNPKEVDGDIVPHLVNMTKRGADQIGGVDYGGPRHSILVTDDNPDHCAILTNMLGAIGFRVLTASSGAACLETAQREQPELVVLDVSMPGMNGWEVAAALREIVSPSSRIIMLSGNAHEIDSHREAVRYHDAVHIKPFMMDSLLRTIADLLDIEWILEADPSPAGPVYAPRRAWVAESGELHLPGVHELEDLKRLGEIGYVRGIRDKLSDLASRPQDYRWLVERLEPMVQNLDFPRYLDTLSALITEASGK